MIQYLVVNQPADVPCEYTIWKSIIDAISYAQNCLKVPASGPPSTHRYDDRADGVRFVGTRAFPLSIVVVRELEVEGLAKGEMEDPTMSFKQAMVLFTVMCGDHEIGVDEEGTLASDWISPEVNSAIRLACSSVPHYDTWRRAQNNHMVARETITGFVTYMRGWLNALELGMEKP